MKILASEIYEIVIPEVVEGYLRGELPDAMALYRIAKALDVSMEWLLTGEEVRIRKEGLP